MHKYIINGFCLVEWREEGANKYTSTQTPQHAHLQNSHKTFPLLKVSSHIVSTSRSTPCQSSQMQKHYIWSQERGHDTWMGGCWHIPHLAHYRRNGQVYWAYCRSSGAIGFTNLAGVVHVLVHQGIHRQEAYHWTRKDNPIKEDRLPMPPHNQTVSRLLTRSSGSMTNSMITPLAMRSLLSQMVGHNQRTVKMRPIRKPLITEDTRGLQRRI